MSYKFVFVCIFVVWSSSASADLLLTQKLTSEAETRDITQYVGKDRMRIDSKGRDDLSVTIVDMEKLITCTKKLKQKQKGTCQVIRVADMQKMTNEMAKLPGMKMELKEYTVSDLRKKGNYAGRSCDMFERRMTFIVNLSGMQHTQKLTEQFCNDRTVKVTLDGLGQKIMSGMNFTANDQGMWKRIVSEEKKFAGLTLYHMTQTQSEMDMPKASKAMFGQMMQGVSDQKPTKSVTETLSVKETSLQGGIYEVPSDMFKLPEEANMAKQAVKKGKKRTKKTKKNKK